MTDRIAPDRLALMRDAGSLDDLPFEYDDGRKPNGATGRPKCRKHEWTWAGPTPEDGERCRFCHHVRDVTAARRGKSARRLGSDQERRIERVYGPTKIGERGDPVDHLGRVWKWQSKATRDDPPLWLARITEPTHREILPLWVERPWAAMRDIYNSRLPVVIRSYVHTGRATADWLFVDCADAEDELGVKCPLRVCLGWWVIPGDWWLDHFGRDEEDAA